MLLQRGVSFLWPDASKSVPPGRGARDGGQLHWQKATRAPELPGARHTSSSGTNPALPVLKGKGEGRGEPPPCPQSPCKLLGLIPGSHPSPAPSSSGSRLEEARLHSPAVGQPLGSCPQQRPCDADCALQRTSPGCVKSPISRARDTIQPHQGSGGSRSHPPSRETHLCALKQRHCPLHPPVSPSSQPGRAVSPLLPSRDLGEKLEDEQVLI